jgi:tetratricopeptide (TPR) repeat protein
MAVETKTVFAKSTSIAPVSPLIEPAAPHAEPYKHDALEHYNDAVRLHQQGLLDGAKQDYLKAVRIDPRIEEAWCNLGGIYDREKNYEKAEEVFKKSLAANLPPPATPNSTRFLALSYLARLYFSRGDYEKAEPFFKEALTANPEKVVGFEETKEKYIEMLSRAGRSEESSCIRVRRMP